MQRFFVFEKKKMFHDRLNDARDAAGDSSSSSTQFLKREVIFSV